MNSLDIFVISITACICGAGSSYLVTELRFRRLDNALLTVLRAISQTPAKSPEQTHRNPEEVD